ncbi:hypothetical protein [Adlercreutzia equolifaciens]|uniref:hypothetical protein n=1 Tax=Adlercreutzia equolifaciens TaxID=446660 RepID=UPI001CC7D12B|nr:hypothetical protein [Adlercreutzia equolifaciens]
MRLAPLQKIGRPPAPPAPAPARRPTVAELEERRLLALRWLSLAAVVAVLAATWTLACAVGDAMAAAAQSFPWR